MALAGNQQLHYFEGPDVVLLAEANVMTGDFNGDGLGDAVEVSVSGGLRVMLGSHSGFEVVAAWGSWTTGANASDLRVGDFNGDGLDDLIARGVDGRWRIQQSSGSAFSQVLGPKWATDGWVNGESVVGDFNGDGRDDVGLRRETGHWYLLYGGEIFRTVYTGRWSEDSYDWFDIQTGDVNGDGRSDIVARTNLGGWFSLQLPSGSRFGMRPLKRLNPDATWHDATVADFNGDGIDDIGTWNASGAWWVIENSSTQSGLRKYGGWDASLDWKTTIADIDLDGRADIAGWVAATGELRLLGSTETTFRIDQLNADFQLQSVGELFAIPGGGESLGIAQKVVEIYNRGRTDIVGTLESLIDGSLGIDLPLVRESITDALEVFQKYRQAFEQGLHDALSIDELEQAWRALESAGFRLEYAGRTVDAQGDLLRVTFDRSFLSQRPTFNVGGETQFSYFDDDVTGQLSGNLNVEVPEVAVSITFGVDLVNGLPAFFVSDTSSVSFTGLNGTTGNVAGNLAIRNLAYVEATGSLAMNLSGSLTLRDSDSDHKLRINDFGRNDVMVGDIDGQIVLDGSLTTNVPVLGDLTWQGQWRANFDEPQGEAPRAPEISGGLQNLPSAVDVERAIINSFLEMKDSFQFLTPIAGFLDTKLDILEKSIADLTGVGGKLGWLNEGADALSSVKEELRVLGIEIIDVNTATVQKLLTGEKVDLITFHQADSGTLLSEHAEFLVAAAPVGGLFAVTVSGTVDAELGWNYEVGFGLDTTGVWIDPRTSIGIYGSVSAGIEAELTLAGLVGLEIGAGAGMQLFAGLGLRDPDAADGRIYMDEIWRGAEDSRSLEQAILDVIHVNMRLDAQGYVRAALDLPWPLPDVTLVDESFNLGAIIDSQQSAVQTRSLRRLPLSGQAGLAMPANLLSNGTLVLTGTEDRDYVGLKRTAGTVQVRWAGFETATFENVTNVVFYGNGEDDSLTVDQDFDLPITADGGEGNDFLMGGTLGDTLSGGNGNDEIDGGKGDDQINGGGGNDILRGGDGNDTILGGADRDLIYGGDGNDNLSGQGGIDAIEGGAGDDQLDGGEESDALYGGDGNDLLSGGNANDNLSGGAGDDRLFGGAADDVLDGGSGSDLLEGGSGDDLLIGGSENDTLKGDDGNDIILAGSGNDWANGGRGNDVIRGEAGNDQLFGSLASDAVVDVEDQDILLGGDGLDILRGGRGNDNLNGEAGADDINGEAGEDVIILDLTTSAGSIRDTLAGGVDRDTLWISPAYSQSSSISSEAKNFFGQRTSEILDGTDPETKTESQLRSEASQLQMLRESAATNGTGDNRIKLNQVNVNDFLVEQYDPNTNQLVAKLDFTLSGGIDTDLETITIAGMDGDDIIEVSANTTRNVILDGGDGNDTLLGGSGRDIIRGGNGNDSLYGNLGDDELHGDAGDDRLEGGEGTDRLYGGDDDDTLNGGPGFDVHFGGDGDDYMTAGPGPFGDIMYGDSGASLSPGNDTIIGGDGSDVIFGGPGSDILEGRGSADVILGEDGNDTIRGGAGADFIFGGNHNDILYSFTDDQQQIDQFEQMDWNQRAAQLDDHFDNLTDDFWLVDEEIDAIDMLDGVPGDKKINAITTQGVSSVQALLTAAMTRLNSLFSQIASGAITRSEVDREITHLLTRVFVLDGLDGIGKQDLEDTEANFRTASFDASLLPSIEELQLRIDELLPVAGELESAKNHARDLLNEIPSEYTAVTSDLVDGGDGDDHFFGTRFSERFFGNAGDDTFHHSEGNDEIVGGAGNFDAYVLEATEQDDTVIISGVQDETTNLVFDVQLNASQPQSRISLAPDVEGIGVYGLGGNDTMTALLGQNALKNVVFDGGSGNDTIDVSGIESKSKLYGGPDDDTITGGKLDDEIYGGSGFDTIFGGPGRDELYGEGENDILDGGADNDTIFGGSGFDTLFGGSGEDYLYGEGDGETFIGLGEGDHFDGGGGDDVITYSNYSEGLLIDLEAGYVRKLSSQTVNIDTLTNIRTIIGTEFSDVIYGDVQNNVIYGQDGSDVIDGRGGNDEIYGGDHDDVIYGGGDHDQLFGGWGRDEIRGGAGDDVIDGGEESDWLRGDSGSDTIYGGVGGDGDDIEGGSEDDTIDGGDGNDLIKGDGGSDTIQGGAGSDTIYFDPSDIAWNFEAVIGVHTAVQARGQFFIWDNSAGWKHESNGTWKRFIISNSHPIIEANDRIFMHQDNRAVGEYDFQNERWVDTTGPDIITFLKADGRLYVLPDNRAVWEFDFSDSRWIQITSLNSVSSIFIHNGVLHREDLPTGQLQIRYWHRLNGEWKTGLFEGVIRF
ncbi:MAG: VCBS repeat-containing protein [Planctomycetaceae bacterium]|nr:VCBS repeat-containing protein [Planctomycetaceae bacterium]